MAYIADLTEEVREHFNLYADLIQQEIAVSADMIELQDLLHSMKDDDPDDIIDFGVDCILAYAKEKGFTKNKREKLSYAWGEKEGQLFKLFKRGESVLTAATSFGFPQKSGAALTGWLNKYGGKERFMIDYANKLKERTTKVINLPVSEVKAEELNGLPRPKNQALLFYIEMLEECVGHDKAVRLKSLANKFAKGGE